MRARVGIDMKANYRFNSGNYVINKDIIYLSIYNH